jgi:hypothetical protein
MLNHSDEAVDVEVEEPGIDWVRGKEISGSLHLNPLGLATIQLSSARAAPSADFR